MGMMMLPPVIGSLLLQAVLFVLVDNWRLITDGPSPACVDKDILLPASMNARSSAQIG